MNAIDIVILFLIGIGVIMGMMKGFVRQLSSLVGLVVGLLVARLLFSEVGDWISPAIGVPVSIGRTLAFFMIWIIVPLLFSLLASLLTRVLNVIQLGWLNRWLGGGLGAIKLMLFIGLSIQLIEFVDSNGELFPKTLKQESLLYEPMKGFAGMFIPVIKEASEQIIQVAT